MKNNLSLVSALLLSSTSLTAQVKDLGDQLELLWDKTQIADLAGKAQLILHHPTYQEVSLVHDQPWEGNVCCYHTVFKDDLNYKMYYRGGVHKMPDLPDHPEFTCLAVSTDGIAWEKPNFGLIEFNGSKNNNIIWVGSPAAHNFAPFHDQNPNCHPEQKYKAIAGKSQGLLAYASPDGIHWTKIQDEPVMTGGSYDSLNVAFWDSWQKKYLAYSRFFKKDVGRAIKVYYSEDFLHWSDPVWLNYEEGTPNEQLYTNGIHQYHRSPAMRLGLPKRFITSRKSPHDPSDAGGIPGVSDGVFMCSRDGVNFSRWSEAFLRPGLQYERWINRNNMAAWGTVETAAAIPGLPPEISLYATEGYYSNQANKIRRLTLRLDGFVSVNAPFTGGSVTSKPLTFTATPKPVEAPTADAQIRKNEQGNNVLAITAPTIISLNNTAELGNKVTFACTFDKMVPGHRRIFSSYNGGPNQKGQQKLVIDGCFGSFFASQERKIGFRVWYDGLEAVITSEECPDWPSISTGPLKTVVVYEDGIISIFLNGKQVASAGQAGYGPLVLPVGDVRFGEDYLPASLNNEPFLGEAEEIAVINRSFTAAEVATAAQQGLVAVIDCANDQGAYLGFTSEQQYSVTNKLQANPYTTSLSQYCWGETMLLLNASTSAAGSIRCEIRDANNQPIPGFELGNCQPLFGDDIELIMRWDHGVELSQLADKPISLHFALVDADLFAYRFGQPRQYR